MASAYMAAAQEPPLGVSFEFLRRFLDFPQMPASDPRIGKPVLDLIREAPGEYWSPLKKRYKGLSFPIEDHLDLPELKALAKELFISPSTVDVNELAKPGTWAKALNRPATSTADCCFFSVVKPDTFDGPTGPSCAYTELLQRSNALSDEGRPLVGPATYFVSHAWSYDFRAFARALMEFWEERPRDEVHRNCYFWIDIFSVDQHRASNGDFDSSFWETTFTEMIRTIGRTVVVLLPWSNPVPIRRIWCLWELFSTIETKSELWVAIPAEEEKLLDEACLLDCENVIKRIEIDAEHADATDPNDKLKISKTILTKHGTWDVINSRVHGAYMGVFLNQMSWYGEEIGGTPAFCQRLVEEKGALVDVAYRPVKAARKRTPVGHAAARGNIGILEMFYKLGTDLERLDPIRGFSPLHLATIHNKIACVQWLSLHVPLNAVGKFWKRTPLHLAVTYGHVEMVKCLVNLGARVDLVDSHGSTALALALRKDNEEGGRRELDEPLKQSWTSGNELKERRRMIAEFLQTINAPGVSLQQRINDACQDLDVERLEEFLLESNEDEAVVFNRPTTTSQESLLQSQLGHALGSLAVRAPDNLEPTEKMIARLLEGGAKPWDSVAMKSTGVLLVKEYSAFHLACFKGILPAVKLFSAYCKSINGFDLDALVNSRSFGDGGYTPLMYASQNDRLDVVEYLLEELNADVLLRVESGHCAGLTALGLARRNSPPGSTTYKFMIPESRARRRAVIERLLAAVQGMGETGAESHHGTPDPPEEENESMVGKQELMNLGFKEDAVDAAWEQSNNNFEAAIELLLSTTSDALNPQNQE